MHKCELCGGGRKAVVTVEYDTESGYYNVWDVCESHRLDLLYKAEQDLIHNYCEYEVGTTTTRELCS